MCACEIRSDWLPAAGVRWIRNHCRPMWQRELCGHDILTRAADMTWNQTEESNVCVINLLYGHAYNGAQLCTDMYACRWLQGHGLR